MLSASLLLGLAQQMVQSPDAEAQRVVEAMVTATNAAPPPGIKRATAGLRMVTLHLEPPPAVDGATFADMFFKNSVGFICNDPGMRQGTDLHRITYRISVEPGGRPKPIIRDITSATCASIPSPIAAAPPQSSGNATSTDQLALQGEELKGLAQQAREFTPRDQFDARPAARSVNGKRFSYTVTPLQTGPQNLICGGTASWGYWAQDSRLEVNAGVGTGLKSSFSSLTNGPMFPSTPGQSDFATLVSYRSLACAKTRLPSYMATNGFGAQFEVQKSREVVTAVGEFAAPDTKWKTYWTTQVSGEQARQLSRNVRVRISGILRDWAPGKPVLCGRKNALPTTQLPYDETTEICMFNGHSDLFEILDASTGAVLYASRRNTL